MTQIQYKNARMNKKSKLEEYNFKQERETKKKKKKKVWQKSSARPKILPQPINIHTA